VRQLKAVVADRCEGGLPAIVHAMNYPHAVPLVTPGEEHGPIKGLVIDDRQSVPASIPAIMDEVVGLIHGTQASGVLSSSIFVNESGQPDPKGNMACAGAKVHWHARFHP
jgi:hypothetical protein